MNNYLLYNGRFYKDNHPIITADNRGLRYGDGLFETLKYTGEQIQFKDWHFERLFHGLQSLQFELPAHFTAAALAGQLTGLCKKNGHADARVRITVVRGNGGLYDLQNHSPECIIQSWPLPAARYQLNENGLVTGIYTEARKAPDSFANLKNNNYLPYAMAALHAKKNRWNDAFILNTQDRICDATIANVFIIKNGFLYTSPLQEGGIAGIMRRYLLENLRENGFTVQEQPISISQLLAADEVFLTNVIKGIRWVSHCEESVYTNTITSRIHQKILQN